MARYMPSTDRNASVSAPISSRISSRLWVDAIIVGVEDRRRGETEVNFAGAGVAHHADDLLRGGAAHQRIVDQDDALALDRGAIGRVLHAHAQFAHALG